MHAILFVFLAGVHFCAAQDVDPLPMRSDYSGEHERSQNKVHYFSDAALEEYKVYFVEGRALDQSGRPLNTFLNSRSIFVIDGDESFYFVPFPSQNFIHHSSLSRASELYAAGQIIIVDGRILAVDLMSGHYRHPPQYLDYLKSYFTQRGVSIPQSAWDADSVNREMKILNPGCDRLAAR